jgi:hypothetical protein
MEGETDEDQNYPDFPVFHPVNDKNCEAAILKSYFMCTFYLIILPLCDIKITLDSEEKCKLFSWRAQQKKWPIQSLIEKREGKIV